MQFSSVVAIMAAFASTTLAMPSASPNEISARATKCNAGAVYCGWWLIDQNGWDAGNLRNILCNKLGKCDFNSGDAWNSLWHCTGDWSIEPKAVCGGKNSCAGPLAHCT